MIKVLIADDQELIRQSLQIVLGVEKDLEVMEPAANGLEVIRAVRKEKPDVILMDIRMPEMDGAEATRRIREFCPAIPIIAVTANAFDEDRRRAFEAGVDDFLTKPLSKAKLFETINRY